MCIGLRHHVDTNLIGSCLIGCVGAQNSHVRTGVCEDVMHLWDRLPWYIAGDRNWLLVVVYTDSACYYRNGGVHSMECIAVVM